MKKIFLCLMFFTLLWSCKKENGGDKSVEDSRQLLKKVVLTPASGLSFDVAVYQYNSKGRIIAEGSKTYVRDEKQRIVRILEPGTLTNRADIQVYYSSPESGKIAYTLCTLVGGSARDSVVYVHDNAGRLEKKLSYFSQLSTDNLPLGTFLAHYDVFDYDESGNLQELNFYNIDQGKTSHCGQYLFSGYDNNNNPQYTDDEARAMEYFCDGVINVSKNNFTRINNATKTYVIRSDGRPRSCTVTSPTQSFSLTFEYE
jgi:hypothetical protein